jgi:hypothetical protein
MYKRGRPALHTRALNLESSPGVWDAGEKSIWRANSPRSPFAFDTAAFRVLWATVMRLARMSIALFCLTTEISSR